MRTSQRGSALLTAVVVILVITVIGVGIIRFASREIAGSTASAKEQALIACAETARSLLLSQFHALGLQPMSLQPFNVPLDGSTGSARTWAVGGHYDTAEARGSTPPAVSITQVTLLPESAFGPSTRVRDLTNVIAIAGQGGRPMKVVVHCQMGGTSDPTSGTQLEVEFGVRFGL
jgi:type II secretory pathway pseudopilin PulG